LPRHRGTSAHFAITGTSDSDAARTRNAMEASATEQTVTHVTAAYAAWAIADAAVDRAEMEGWA
jgi:hypothetical protein